MTTRLRFLGVAGYEVVAPQARILIDPFLSGNPLAPCRAEDLETPDVILVTHAPWDHLGDTADIALRTGAPVVCGPDVRLVLMDRGVPAAQIRATVWGVVVEVNGVVVRPIESRHWSMGRLSNEQHVAGIPLAYIVECEKDVRLYHFGDTAFHDLSLVGATYQPTVGVLGCTVAQELVADDGGAGYVRTGEMTPSEAVSAARMLGLNVAVASHYLAHNDDTDEWARLGKQAGADTGCTFLTPTVGDVVVTDGWTGHIEVVGS